MKLKKILFTTLATFMAISAIAQLGTIDPDFNLGSGFGPDQWTGRCEVIVQQPDGKLLVGGWFTEYDGTPAVRIARLNLDGSIDDSFQTGDGFTGVSAYVKTIALQPDGKILVGGNFLEFDGVIRHRIARLHADGSLDTSFDPLTGFNSDISTIVVQPDGKIIVAGIFSAYDWLNDGGVTRNRIARLNADGSLDTSFDPEDGIISTAGQARVNKVALQSDGKILACGQFTDYQDNTRIVIARLHSDGSLDTSFDASDNFVEVAGFYGEAWDMKLLPDEKIIIGGNFHYTGAGKGLARLNADGSHDTTFELNNGGFTSFDVQSDGKTVVTTSGPYIVRRYAADGTLDAGFPENELNDWAKSTIIQQDGNITFVGHFYYNPTGIMRLIGDTPMSVGEGGNAALDLIVYPNPAREFINAANIPQGSELRIVDLTGKVLFEQKASHSQLTIDVSGFANGIYLLQVENDGAVMNKKILVNN